MSRPMPRYRPDTDPHKLDRIIDPTTNEPTPSKLGRRSAARLAAWKQKHEATA